MFQIIKMFYLEDFQEIELNEKSNSSSGNDEWNNLLINQLIWNLNFNLRNTIIRFIDFVNCIFK